MGGRGSYSRVGQRASIYIPRSIGAAFYLRNVMDIDGSIVELAVDTRIDNIEVIAGAGVSRKIDEVDKLVRRHKGTKRAEWQKVKGIGTVVRDGIEMKAELHWYEIQGEGIEYDIKVVRYLL